MDETYTPDKLLAGNEFPALTKSITILSGQNLKRGSVLGIITATGKGQLLDKAENDGQNTAKYILAFDVDASSADAPGVVYETGIFNPDALIFAEGTVVADAEADLRARSIFLRSVRTL